MAGWYNKRLARERGATDWRRSTRLQPVDARDANPDPCPRSRTGRHCYTGKMINAHGDPMCDFCRQTKVTR